MEDENIEDLEFAYIESLGKKTTFGRFLYWEALEPPLTLNSIGSTMAWHYATPEERARVAHYFEIPELRVLFADGIDFWKRGTIPGVSGLVCKKDERGSSRWSVLKTP